MKVKLLTSRGGPGISQNTGDIVEVDSDEAKRMFESIPPQAIPVRSEDAVERAVKTGPRKYVKKAKVED